MTDKNKVYTEIEINASKQQVWSVLTDFEKLAEWSSSFKNLEVEGELKTGAKATSTYAGPLKGHDMKFEHELIEVVEGVSFGWSDPLGLMGLSDHHIFKLEDLGDGRTKFIQTDSVEGKMSRFLGKILANNMDGLYQKFNAELKERVETIYSK